MPPGVNFTHKTTDFYTLHTNAYDRLDDIPIRHKPHFPQITSVFKPSHNMVRSTEERFAMERMATRGFGAKKIATALRVPEAATNRCGHFGRVYHRTWAGSRDMFEKIGNAWVRRLKACVAARGCFFFFF